jgi:hypothetical protein
MVEKDQFFSMFYRLGLCVHLKFLLLFFFKANRIVGFGGLNLFSLLFE